ncbi:MAG: hypothetical protein MMC33_009648 [Icmadophila ericetorum]|nr:hypothetical protein [Icmadophila ericetorum]
MSRPSPLAIATSSVLRLVKEEQSYHKELEGQEARVRKLEQGSEDEEGNKEYVLRQEVSLRRGPPGIGSGRKAVEETKAMFVTLNARIRDTLGKLEGELESEQTKGEGSNAEEITKAKEAVVKAMTCIRESS